MLDARFWIKKTNNHEITKRTSRLRHSMATPRQEVRKRGFSGKKSKITCHLPFVTSHRSFVTGYLFFSPLEVGRCTFDVGRSLSFLPYALCSTLCPSSSLCSSLCPLSFVVRPSKASSFVDRRSSFPKRTVKYPAASRPFAREAR